MMHNTELPLSVDDLEAAAGEVLTALQVPFDDFDVPIDSPDRLVARVSVRGEGAIDLTVDVPSRVAAQVAALFFGTESGAASANDLVDAIGELANITAGAIKPMLEGHWTIGIPDCNDPAPIQTSNTIECTVPLGRGAAKILVGLAASAETTT